MADLTVEVDLILEELERACIEEDRISDLTEFVLGQAGAKGKWSIAIVLTSDVHIQRLHSEYMGIDSPTDVMTFPADPVEGESDAGGDVVISVDRAAEQGPEHGESTEQEIEYLVVHGLLHLCGWDDHEENDRARMLEYQTELIRQFENHVNSNY